TPGARRALGQRRERAAHWDNAGSAPRTGTTPGARSAPTGNKKALGFHREPTRNALRRARYFARAIVLLCRAALFLWIRPLRAARSRRTVASRRTSFDEPATMAFLSAVRSSARCARLRTSAARALRIAF